MASLFYNITNFSMERHRPVAGQLRFAALRCASLFAVAPASIGSLWPPIVFRITSSLFCRLDGDWLDLELGAWRLTFNPRADDSAGCEGLLPRSNRLLELG